MTDLKSKMFFDHIIDNMLHAVSVKIVNLFFVSIEYIDLTNSFVFSFAIIRWCTIGIAIIFVVAKAVIMFGVHVGKIGHICSLKFLS